MRIKKRRSPFYTITGLVLTALYLLWIAWNTSYGEIAALEPDKLGTFLGGAAGPPAFLWLVLGFFQQGDELRNSADALELQGEELRHSVEQQKALVDVTREQIEHGRAELEHAEREAERQAQPQLGIQQSGATYSSGAKSFMFTIANAGAPITNVELWEGTRSHGGAATMRAGEGLSVQFDFEVGQEPFDRTLTLRYTDARGLPKTRTFEFRARQVEGRTILTVPREFAD